MKFALLTSLALAAGLAQAQNPAPGVARSEIALGTILDLSGPVAAYGKQIRMGMELRVQEANELGGVHGRKIRLLVEDDGYDPKKSALAAKKLVSEGSGIFAMIGHTGTAHNLAAIPVQVEHNVINFFPITSAREMYEPVHRLKWANLATYYDQMRIAAPRLMKDRKLAKGCIIYQDDDFGREVLRGAEAGLKSIGKEFVEQTSYQRGATDFSVQVAKMKAAGCDLVVLGTIIRETIGTMSEARKIGFNPVFIGSSTTYTDIIPKLGGKLAEGLFATMTSQHPYLDSVEQPIRFWAGKYSTRYNEDPTVFSVYGWSAMDAFLKVAFKAGPALSTDSFLKTLEGMTFNRDMFGSAELSFKPDRHLGNHFSRLSQVQEGRWKVVSDYVAFSGLRPVLQKDGKWKVQSEFFND